jgi:hypothetical protein
MLAMVKVEKWKSMKVEELKENGDVEMVGMSRSLGDPWVEKEECTHDVMTHQQTNPKK